MKPSCFDDEVIDGVIAAMKPTAFLRLAMETDDRGLIVAGHYRIVADLRLAMETGNHRLIAADHYRKLWRSRVAQLR